MGKSSQKFFQLARRSLKKSIGTGELFSVGYGDVGSSIYYTLGATALYAMGATPIALMIAGCVFICTALTYAELSTTFPEAGGSATYTRYAFNDLISFCAGWGLLLDYLLTLAISAFTIPAYLKHFFNKIGIEGVVSGEMHTVIVVCIILLLLWINIVGIKSSGRFSLVLAVFTLITQFGIVLLGSLLVLNLPYVFDQMRINVPGASWSPDWWQFWKGTAMAMVSYTGIEAISQMAEETAKPSVSIPRAIKWTISILLFLYFGLASVGLSVVSPEELGTKYLEDSIAGIAANFPVGGQILAPWVGVTAAIILLICANAGLIGCSRLIFSMSANYQLPRVFSKLHSKYQSPFVSLISFSLIAIGVIFWSRNRMLALADLYNFGAQVAFFSAHMALITLRLKKPELKRPYKAPLNIPFGSGKTVPFTALFGAFAAFSVLCLVIITKPDGRVAGLTWMIIGLIIYAFYRKKKNIALSGSLEVEQVKVPEYTPMLVKNILVTIRITGGTEALQTAIQMGKKEKAKITAVYVLEIPETVDLNAKMKGLEKLGVLALQKAEAIARENHSTIDCQLIRSRSFDKALLHLIDDQKFDYVIVNIDKRGFNTSRYKSNQLEHFFLKAPCPVIFCKT